MLKRSREERALSKVASEVRRAPDAPVDWARVERRLLARVAREELAPARRRPHSVTPWFAPAFAILFAAVVVLLVGGSDPSPPARVAEIPSSIDGDAVSAEGLLTAEREPLTITHGTRAAWTLSPGSQARVALHGEVIRVRLLAGALHARVTPSPVAERFVVEAGETRVAVHGTVFSVSMDRQGTVVRVEEGTVAVNSHGEQRVFLRAPAKARFAAPVRVPEPAAAQRRTVPQRAPRPAPAAGDPPGDTSEVPAHTSEVPAHTSEVPAHTSEVPAHTSEVPAHTSEMPAETHAGPAASSSEPAIAAELTIGEVEAGVAVLVAAANQCFERHTAASGDLRITARTEVTLTVVSDGSVSSVAFSPPLAPAVQACSEREAKALSFPASQNGASVRRLLELGAWRSRRL